MPRTGDKPSRIELLLLSCLARLPMSGYDLKLELRYRHVRWWAKCEHGHVYAALKRLARRRDIRDVPAPRSPRKRRVFAITPAGRTRFRRALERVGGGADETYFDIDLFVAGMYVLDRRRVLRILARRRARLAADLRQAAALRKRMAGLVPLAGRLIMEHRVEHLQREIDFTTRAMATVRAERAWRAFLGKEPIRTFVERTRVPLEKSRTYSARQYSTSPRPST